MSHTILPLIVLFALLAIFVVIGAAMKRHNVKAGVSDDAENEAAPAVTDYDGYYRKKFLFTKAEYSFFGVLQMTVGGEYSIQAKVRIADLIDVRNACSNHRRKVNYITSKHLDFVLCEPKTMVPVLCIELDDSSHDSPKTQKRDAFVDGLLEAVGMPLVRVIAARGYAMPELKASIEKALEPKAA